MPRRDARARPGRSPRRRRGAAAGPSRVVTLAPNLTEIVFALGAGDRLVGVSEYSDYPEAARAIPRVGGLEVDPEKVAALSPDLVLAIAEGSGRGAVGALEAAGVPVVVVPSGSLDAVLEAIRIVGQRLGARRRGAGPRRRALPKESRRARPGGVVEAAAHAPARLAGPAAGGRAGNVSRRRPRRGRRRERGRRTGGAGPFSRRSTSRPRTSTSSSCPTRRKPGPPTSAPFPRARSRADRSPAPASCAWTRPR